YCVINLAADPAAHAVCSLSPRKEREREKALAPHAQSSDAVALANTINGLGCHAAVMELSYECVCVFQIEEKILKLIDAITVAGVLAVACLTPAKAADISGAGATFPYPVYAKWADAYKQQTGIGINYQSIGSGAGIKQIQARTVVFGATDAPLKGAQLAKDALVQFPMVMGGVVPVVNVDGVSAGQLILDGPTLSKIFLGEIKSWNDAAIQKLNAGVKLPAQMIALVHRSDGSG